MNSNPSQSIEYSQEKQESGACHLILLIGYTKMDLGIARYHFEIGAGEVNFDWVWI